MDNKVNGCGPKWFPDCIRKHLGCYFKKECNLHDARYGIGGTEGDRIHIDWLFLKSMLSSVGRMRWYHKLPAFCMAVSFYIVVFVFGWSRFEYRKN